MGPPGFPRVLEQRGCLGPMQQLAEPVITSAWPVPGTDLVQQNYPHKQNETATTISMLRGFERIFK